MLAALSLPASPQQSPPAATGYLGSEGCRGCHAELFRRFESTAHWKTTLSFRGAATPRGCESCHGPGKEHGDTLGDPQKIIGFRALKPAQVAERCLECHQYGEEHANFRRSAHRSANVTCLNCHSVHHAAEKQYLLRMSQPQLCYGCHRRAQAEFARPFRHRVDEGLVKCTECHNQHGGFLTRQLRSTAAQEAICGKCHAETVGPFVFEHPPQKTEGCGSCHAPHGSVNPRLLLRSRVNQLCLECHTPSRNAQATGTPGFHNQDQAFQACTLCHVQIHGSNVSALLMK